MSEAEVKRGRGRPVVFSGDVKTEIVRLIGLFGIKQTIKVLGSEKRTKIAQNRDLTLIPRPLKISAPTLVKFGKEAGVCLKRGRPSKAEAA